MMAKKTLRCSCRGRWDLRVRFEDPPVIMVKLLPGGGVVPFSQRYLDPVKDAASAPGDEVEFPVRGSHLDPVFHLGQLLLPIWLTKCAGTILSGLLQPGVAKVLAIFLYFPQLGSMCSNLSTKVSNRCVPQKLEGVYSKRIA